MCYGGSSTSSFFSFLFFFFFLFLEFCGQVCVAFISAVAKMKRIFPRTCFFQARVHVQQEDQDFVVIGGFFFFLKNFLKIKIVAKIAITHMKM